MTYIRVIPRDLFNEGKLLTELGFLSLAILDNVECINSVVEFEHDGEPFDIRLTDSGELCVINLRLIIKTTGEEILLYRVYNSREHGSLMFEYEDTIDYVFSENKLSIEFLSFIRGV